MINDGGKENSGGLSCHASHYSSATFLTSKCLHRSKTNKIHSRTINSAAPLRSINANGSTKKEECRKVEVIIKPLHEDKKYIKSAFRRPGYTKCPGKKVRFKTDLPSNSNEDDVDRNLEFDGSSKLDQQVSDNSFFSETCSPSCLKEVRQETRQDHMPQNVDQYKSQVSLPSIAQVALKVPRQLSSYYPQKYLALIEHSAKHEAYEVSDVIKSTQKSHCFSINAEAVAPCFDIADRKHGNKILEVARTTWIKHIKENLVFVLALFEAIIIVIQTTEEPVKAINGRLNNSKPEAVTITALLKKTNLTILDELFSIILGATITGPTSIHYNATRNNKIHYPKTKNTLQIESFPKRCRILLCLKQSHLENARFYPTLFVDASNGISSIKFHHCIHMAFFLCVAYHIFATFCFCSTPTWYDSQGRSFAQKLSKGLLFVVSLLAIPLFVLTPILPTAMEQHSAIYSFVDLQLRMLSTLVRSNLRMTFDTSRTRVLRRLASFAIFKPKNFIKYLKKTLIGVRWTTFLAPLIGSGNKLRAHATDLSKRRAQRKRSIVAHMNWHKLCIDLKRQYITEDIVITLQANFRGRRDRKALHVLKMWKHKGNMKPSDNIGSWLRQKAAHARKRVERSRSLEISCDDSFDSESSISLPRVMTPQRKRRKLNTSATQIVTDEERRLLMCTAQGFLKSTIQQKRRMLLLKPNTRFAVYWKATTVACVALEFLCKVMAPYVCSGTKTKKLTIDAFLHAMLIQRTGMTSHTTFPRGVSGILLSFKGLLELSQIILRFSFVSSARLIVYLVPGIVSAVCFADVFVSFFTGEEVVSDVNGVRKLVPKAFFTRWICPGVVLQLLVNPTMGRIVQLLQMCYRVSHKAGHCRTLWVLILGIIPLGNKLLDALTFIIWTTTVSKRNNWIS